ncbi:general amidase [Schizopora paradoxa]|uniref:amidase n=1 Tax=Schizopora paradoxa TaxID=27342 RepID=A0A0H2SC84_9AGAM|nr:general amidase [Schizopora paradoxa]
MGSKWETLVADKRKRQTDSIPKEWLISLPSEDCLDVTNVPNECGILTAKELEITELDDVDALLLNLASGKWSSVEVTTAYCKRAFIAQQLTNCLTEIFVERALKRAKELDEHLRKIGKVAGPLHGLPVSLKDQIQVKGLEATLGYASWVGKYSDRDAVIVQILLEAGAVPFVKTNVPQTMIWAETNNLLFGRTVNPHNRKLTAGGSSGGEGALLAMKGSPLGVGTDVGGSVRIPAGFVGIYSLRPSYNRVPYAGAVTTTTEGEESNPTVLGPMSRSLSGIKAFMKVVTAAKPWDRDPLAIKKEWDSDAYALADHGGEGGKNLVFAVMWDNGQIVPHPPVRRALEETKAALIAAGHKVIDWAPFPYERLGKNLERIWLAAGTKFIHDIVAESGEPILPTMGLNPLANGGREFQEGISAYELRQLHQEKQALKEAHLVHWQETAQLTGTGRAVDAIICPMAPGAAPLHGTNDEAYKSFYTSVLSCLNYVAAVFPVTTVDPKLDVRNAPHQFYNKKDQAMFQAYDPEIFKGAPIALQLVGRTLEEEAVIAMTEVVDKALKEYKESKSKL